MFIFWKKCPKWCQIKFQVNSFFARMWLVFSPWGDVRYFQSGVAGSQPAQPSVFWTINLRKSASWIERFLKIVYNLGFLWMHYLNDPNQIPMVARWIHRVEKSQYINVFKQTSNLQAISHQKYLVYFLKPLLSDTYVDLVILMQHSLRSPCSLPIGLKGSR